MKKGLAVAVSMHPFRVKAPVASQGARDHCELVATIPAAEAFKPVAESGRPLTN